MWIDETFGGPEGFNTWYEDYGRPGGYEFSRAGYERWAIAAGLAFDVEHRALVVSGGGYLPGDPRLLALGPPQPTPTPILGGSAMTMNGHAYPLQPAIRTGDGAGTNGFALIPGAWDGGGAVSIDTRVELQSPDTEQVNSILMLMGATVAQITVWLPRIVAAIAAGTAIWAAIKAVTGRAPPAGVAGSPGDQTVGGILQGPGVPEPRAGTFSKTWRIETESQDGRKVYTWFWRMLDGSIVYYSSSGKSGKYRPKKPAAVLMAGGATSLKQAVRAQRILDRMWRTVAKRTKQLKLA